MVSRILPHLQLTVAILFPNIRQYDGSLRREPKITNHEKRQSWKRNIVEYPTFEESIWRSNDLVSELRWSPVVSSSELKKKLSSDHYPGMVAKMIGKVELRTQRIQFWPSIFLNFPLRRNFRLAANEEARGRRSTWTSILPKKRKHSKRKNMVTCHDSSKE
jgi:hypothetical protein